MIQLKKYVKIYLKVLVKELKKKKKEIKIFHMKKLIVIIF